jgi:glycyl-tRNA synthetase beta chain
MEHYSPLGPSDDVPTAPVSVAVALADKLDTLTGFWAIDEKPTGSKDPFALRRAALGVIRLVLENDARARLLPYVMPHISEFERREHDEITRAESEWEQDVAKFLGKSVEEMSRIREEAGLVISSARQPEEFQAEMVKIFGAIDWSEIGLPGEKTGNELLSFFHDRLKVFLRDQGIRHDVIDACIAMDGNDDLTLLVKRARALEDFLKSEDGENLLQGFKRANNILTQAEEKDGVEYSYGADVKFAEDATETALFNALETGQTAISSAIEAEDFAAAMGGMAALRGPIDAFFEAVQVNSDNPVVRRNRLNLLSQIRSVCGQVADLTRVEG